MARGDLTDEEWYVIEGLLPSERGRKARPAHDCQSARKKDPLSASKRAPFAERHDRYDGRSIRAGRGVGRA